MKIAKIVHVCAVSLLLLLISACGKEEPDSPELMAKEIHEALLTGNAELLKQRYTGSDTMLALKQRCQPYVNISRVFEVAKTITLNGKTYFFLAPRGRMGLVFEYGQGDVYRASVIYTPSRNDQAANAVYHQVRCEAENLALPEDVEEYLDENAPEESSEEPESSDAE